MLLIDQYYIDLSAIYLHKANRSLNTLLTSSWRCLIAKGLAISYHWLKYHPVLTLIHHLTRLFQRAFGFGLFDWWLIRWIRLWVRLRSCFFLGGELATGSVKERMTHFGHYGECRWFRTCRFSHLSSYLTDSEGLDWWFLFSLWCDRLCWRKAVFLIRIGQTDSHSLLLAHILLSVFALCPSL